MENQTNSSSLKKFLIKVIIVDVGSIAVSIFISISQNLNFGIILLILGILIGGIGNFLGGPNLNSRQNVQELKSQHRPNEALSERISEYLVRSIPHYGFENVMMFSGLIGIIISISFLLILMF